MDQHRIIWLTLGGIGMLGVAYVMYLFVAAPLPQRYVEDWNAEAKVQLVHLCELQKTYFTQHHRYNDTLEKVGFYQAETDGGKYWLEMGPHDSTGFVARAFAREDFDKDGEQSIWEITQACEPKEISQD